MPVLVVARAINEKIQAADDTLGELLDKLSVLEKEELAKEEAKRLETMKQKIREDVGPIITKAWQKNLATAEKAAAKGDKEGTPRRGSYGLICVSATRRRKQRRKPHDASMRTALPTIY